ncbi:MAG: isoprenylcysteine carboxylmethyltransferase family protein [Candidatus Binatia bacterium]
MRLSARYAAGMVRSVLVPALVVAGVWWLAWAALVLGWRRWIGLTAAPPHPEHPRLVLAGPFRRARHPQTLGGLCLAAAAAIAWWSPSVAVGSGLASTALLMRARRDDAVQAKRFGAAYARYRRAVPFLFPRWR